MKKELKKRLFWNFALALFFLSVSLVISAVNGASPALSDVWEEDGAEDITDGEDLFRLPVIVIDPGHGGVDCGAVGVNGVLEKDVNLILSFFIKKEFENVGYTVIMTREEDILLTDSSAAHTTKKSADLAARVNTAKEGDIFISIHMNKFPEEKYSGAQIYYSVNHQGSKKLADMIQSGIKLSLQSDNNRMIKSGEGLYLLDRIKCPAVIAECGFLSNTKEAELLKDEAYLRKLAFEIFSAVDDFVIECAWQS